MKLASRSRPPYLEVGGSWEACCVYRVPVDIPFGPVGKPAGGKAESQFEWGPDEGTATSFRMTNWTGIVVQATVRWSGMLKAE